MQTTDVALHHPHFVEFVEKLAKWRDMKLTAWFHETWELADFYKFKKREEIFERFEDRQLRTERFVQECIDAGEPVPSPEELFVWHSLRLPPHLAGLDA